MNFSRRKAMQPLPPSPALTRIFASSMNIVAGRQPLVVEKAMLRQVYLAAVAFQKRE
jgi:hypothetical protein